MKSSTTCISHKILFDR